MTIQSIEQKETFEQVLEQHNKFLLLKHSLTCPISADAENTFKRYDEETNTPLYILPIQQARELSNYIAEEFGVKHQSPQALLFEKKQVKWDASHWKITNDALKKVDTE
ncbi:bacillithiol system redox-active protein YtxJ [Pontibacillus yanchengensis]|uniref:Bacillithiol system redox-active protein YtxJ n=2 Tax=Pontibacillus yanchengensis TaxID=462910 RepID=A0ACC7VCL8_9BACI|nr:bacillithiol system redox-active protein YtxJ [Pontibacillus yanchengensis]MYL34085.1 bacillithiol system redox-active protein YtxJ [Pontibacillus yanchengensis]MYL53173.1 bacillithiol system redox-active protein YtxJ [Pontibacillus yanchengensis]